MAKESNTQIYNKAERCTADSFNGVCKQSERVNVYSQLRRKGWRMVMDRETATRVYFTAYRISAAK